tara:strand:- start:2419 stop:4863 length:2445 start_codon:yes stop_codon:yes gene_type:complete
MAGIEDLEPSISRKMQFGAAQETYLLGDLYRLIKAGLDPNKTIEDIEQERLDKLYEKFPEFESGEYENDAAVWTGRVGIMATDPIYAALPFTRAMALPTLASRLAALSGLSAGAGAVAGTVHGAARGRDISLQDVAINAGVGAVAGPMFYGAGKGIGKGIDWARSPSKGMERVFRGEATGAHPWFSGTNIHTGKSLHPTYKGPDYTGRFGFSRIGFYDTPLQGKHFSKDPSATLKSMRGEAGYWGSKMASKEHGRGGFPVVKYQDLTPYEIQRAALRSSKRAIRLGHEVIVGDPTRWKTDWIATVAANLKPEIIFSLPRRISETFQKIRLNRLANTDDVNFIVKEFNKIEAKGGAGAQAVEDALGPQLLNKIVNLQGTKKEYSKIGQYRGMRKANIARQGDKMKNLETLIKQANKNLDSSKTIQTLAKQVGYKESSVKGRKFTDKVKTKLNTAEENVATAFKRQMKLKDSPVEDFFNLKSKLIKQVTGSDRGPRSLQGEKFWKNLQSKLTSEDIKFLKHLQNTESQGNYIGRGLSYKQAKKRWKISTKSGTQPGVGYAAPERKIMEYARRHYDAGGDKIKFLVPIKDESMASYRNAKFLYKGKEYNLKTLKETSRSDPNFKSFYKAFDKQKRIDAKIVKDPRTGKDIKFGELMGDVYEKATGSRLRSGEIDHAWGVGRDPFKNLRVLDQRTNQAAGQILGKAKRQRQGLLTTKAERYTPANVEKMLKKIGYRHTKTEEEIIRDGLKLARHVLLKSDRFPKGRKLEKPLAVASKRFGIKKGGSIPDLDKYRGTYADGGILIKNRTLMKDLAQLVS